MPSNPSLDGFRFPEYLSSSGELRDAFNQYCAKKSNSDKGTEFAEIVCKIVPLLDFGSEYSEPVINPKKSNDKGIDIRAKSLDEKRTLYIQSKYSITEKAELDSIISKFQDFHETNYEPERSSTPLLSMLESPFSKDDKDIYAVFTLNKLEGIKKKYEESRLASVDFYSFLKDNKQIYMVDGEEILLLLKKTFKREYEKASFVDLKLISKPLRVDNVYVGIAKACAIKDCHDQVGNSIFLDNVRPFLGESSGKKKVSESRSYVNTLIANTLIEEPNKFLGRNNGIVFRASHVEELDDSTLRLTEASIINGCQTTTRIVQFPSSEAYVVTKIVEASDSWDIAKAANFQNYIDVIDLEIACVARPQVIDQMISTVGVSYDSYSPFVILNATHEKRETYLRFRALCIGLFSKTPMNIVASNYTELDDKLIDEFYNSKQERKERIFELIILLYVAAELTHKKAVEKFSSRTYAPMYKRFLNHDKFKYRMIFGILAACGIFGNNIYDTSLDLLSFETFLQAVEPTLIDVVSTKKDNELNLSNQFLDRYNNAFKAVAIKSMETERDEREILQTMTKVIERAKFDNLYNLMELMAE